MRIFVITGIAIILGCLPASLTAQKISERYEQVDGYLRIGPEPERIIPMTERGHTLIIPDGVSKLNGVAVFIDSRRFESESVNLIPGQFNAEALSQNVGVMHITTGNPLDFLFADSAVQDLAVRIEEILEENNLENTPVFLAGLSLGGTRALKLAEFLKAESDKYDLPVAAVAVVDSPLDMVRFWEAERRAAELGFHPAAEDEGRWVMYLLETNLGGTPDEVLSRYVDYSPFVYTAVNGGNAVYLSGIPVRAYHEPDVNWWIENRRNSYYSMNSIDLAALINQLRILGNNRVELVTTHNKRSGYSDGASPHTWSIVDNAELVSWFLDQVKGN